MCRRSDHNYTVAGLESIFCKTFQGVHEHAVVVINLHDVLEGKHFTPENIFPFDRDTALRLFPVVFLCSKTMRTSVLSYGQNNR